MISLKNLALFVLVIVAYFNAKAQATAPADTAAIKIHVDAHPIFAFPQYQLDITKAGDDIDIIFSYQHKDSSEDFFEKKLSRDSVSVKETVVSNLNEVIIKVKNATAEELAGHERPMLDGVSFTFNIQSQSGSKRVFARSPDAESNPLLYLLMKQAILAFQNAGYKDFFKTHPTYIVE